MVLVDSDVAYAVDSYIMWIACMLREIELMTLSGVHLYRIILYRYIIHVVIAISTATEVAFWSFQFENLNLAKKKG